MTGLFQPHRTPDQGARLLHIENALGEISRAVAKLRVGGLAEKNTGSAIIAQINSSASDTGETANLFGDVTGPATNNVAVQASGAFSVLGGDLTVAAGKETITQLDAGGGADLPALRPTFLNLVHHTSAATVPGVGAAVDWTVADSAAADQTVASVIAEITSATAGAVEATLGILVKHQGQDAEVVRFRGQNGMAATNVGTSSALKGYTGGQAWFRGNSLFEGVDGNVMSITDAGTTNTVFPLTLKHLTTGAAAAGLGTEVDLVNQNSSGAAAVTGFIQSLYTGGGTGAENGTLIYGTIYGGARCEIVRFRATGMAVSGGVGGQFWCRGDFLHSGTNLAFYNATPISQPGNTTDLRLVLINLGLLASGGATPLSLNTGQLSNFVVPRATKTGNYTLTNNDLVVNGDTTGGAFTLTLPTAVGADGRFYFLKNTGQVANNLTIATTGGQTIDGGATAALTDLAAIMVVSDNANWWIN